MTLKYLDAYERVKASFNPDSILGKIMNKIMLVYSSKLNFSTVIGFK